MASVSTNDSSTVSDVAAAASGAGSAVALRGSAVGCSSDAAWVATIDEPRSQLHRPACTPTFHFQPSPVPTLRTAERCLDSAAEYAPDAEYAPKYQRRPIQAKERGRR